MADWDLLVVGTNPACRCCRCLPDSSGHCCECTQLGVNMVTLNQAVKSEHWTEKKNTVSGRAVESAQATSLKLLHCSASGDMAYHSGFGLTAVSFFGYDGLLLQIARPSEDNTITFAHSKIKSHLV